MKIENSLLNEFNQIELEYKEKKVRLSEWKNQFKLLEQEIIELSQFFQEKYEESEIDSSFHENIIAKLENRREGVRLSVKSASRLLKKLNPEKPLEDSSESFTTLVDFVEKHVLSSTEKRQLDDSIKEITLMESDPELTEETLKLGTEKCLEVDSNLAEPLAKDTEIAESKNPEFLITETMEETSEKGRNKELFLKTIHENSNVVQEMNEQIELAEKRFLSFIEKALAPVLDGLYSGKNHANDLIAELKDQNHRKIEQVEQWLFIYTLLMDEIERLFSKFLVNFYIPVIGDFFDEYKHEPIGVVEDSNLGDEQVKEVVRYGLIYKGRIYKQDSYLIRPAQVIVVKNKNQLTVDE